MTDWKNARGAEPALKSACDAARKACADMMDAISAMEAWPPEDAFRDMEHAFKSIEDAARRAQQSVKVARAELALRTPRAMRIVTADDDGRVLLAPATGAETDVGGLFVLAPVGGAEADEDGGGDGNGRG